MFVCFKATKSETISESVFEQTAILQKNMLDNDLGVRLHTCVEQLTPAQQQTLIGKVRHVCSVAFEMLAPPLPNDKPTSDDDKYARLGFCVSSKQTKLYAGIVFVYMYCIGAKKDVKRNSSKNEGQFPLFFFHRLT